MELLSPNLLPTGCVHGRFQVFHNDHLRYCLAALDRSERLLVGITSYLVSSLTFVSSAPHRGMSMHNPLTYFERTVMIAAALGDAGVPSHRYSFTPFPIETPDQLRQFVPLDTTCFTTVYDDWNREKVGTLRGIGYRVDILWESDHKAISGTTVRSLIRDADERWRSMVPAASAVWVDRFEVRNRLLDGPVTAN